jgi:hypothetical protein
MMISKKIFTTETEFFHPQSPMRIVICDNKIFEIIKTKTKLCLQDTKLPESSFPSDLKFRFRSDLGSPSKTTSTADPVTPAM